MESKLFKLGIGLPLTDAKVHSQFLDSWTMLEKPNFVYLRPQFPGPIDQIRNNIVKQALESKCTHLLMMDTDQTFPPDLINRLLAHKKDIVGAKVHRRYPPFDPILYKWDDKEGRYYSMPSEDWLDKELVEVDATGGGCTLVKTEVYEKIDFPYYKIVPEVKGKSTIIGEDVYFCKRAKELGYEIYVDCSLELGHLSLLEINKNTYFFYKSVSNHLKKQEE